MPDQATPEDATEPDDADDARGVVADAPVEPLTDDDGEELGEVSGGGDVTDLGGDSPSS